MNLSELITRNRVTREHDITSKKRAMERLGELIAAHDADLTAAEVLESLTSRERLGSTGLGHGVAIPHGRISNSSKAIGAFMRLDRGIDFDAIDGRPVDLVLALVVPEHFTDEHLKILAYLAEMFSEEGFCDRLRAAPTDAALLELLLGWSPGTGRQR